LFEWQPIMPSIPQSNQAPVATGTKKGSPERLPNNFVCTKIRR
jgi:hypothetical protein